MRYKYFLWIFICLCIFGYGQNSRLDSLKNIFENQKELDSIRFEAGLDAFMVLFRKNIDTARVFGNEILKFSQQKNNVNWQAIAYKFVGNANAVKGNYHEALSYFLKSHELLGQLNDYKGRSVTYNNIGTVYYELGHYPRALEYLLEGLKISEANNDTLNLSRLTNNLGNVFLRLENNDKALEYYKYSLKLKKEIGNKYGLVKAYNNVGLVYTNLKDFESALFNLNKCAEISQEIGDKKSLTRAYGNIGEVYNLKGAFSEALDYFNKSIKIKQSINDQEGLVSQYLYRGRSYLYVKNYNQAAIDCQKSLDLSKKMGLLMEEKESCACLSSAWEKLGNYSKSLKFHKLFVAAKDTLFNKDKTQEITEYEMQYKFEKEQLTDSLEFNKQKAARELQFANDLSKQRNKVNLVVFGTIGLFLIGIIYWRSRRKTIKLAQERKVIRRLKQVDEIKDQFLANTSHELRTPLNGIIGLSESLKDGVAGKLPHKAIENLDMITNSGKRLSNLVNDILDFSKLKNKDIVLSLQPVDLYPIASLVLKLSEVFVKDKAVTLINSVPKGIPLAKADENRLQQILYNLVGNAIKFTERGRVEIKAEPQKGQLKISVIDTGIGIPKDKFDSIFKSFEQVDGTTERQYGGTGLGLSVTKQLVELHGGTINVNSIVNKGSEFSFTLPISAEKKNENSFSEKVVGHEKAQSLKPDISAESGTEVVLNTADINILIVDDEPINRRVLENHLTVAGYGVHEVGSGKEALELLDKDYRFDLILLDIMMPNMSGYEVCETIRKRYLTSELPIVLLTAKNRVSDLVAGFNVGANDYLTKPFSKNELLSRIKTHLSLYGIHKATSKFVPFEFLRSVGREAITDVVLGDHIEKEITVLFTDVRDYTSLAESMTPEQNFKFVNAYVGRMGPIIQTNNGFVNQYLGDGIMALFPEQAQDALRACISMQKTIQDYNVRRQNEGFEPIYVGMGLHTGPLIMGIIGDPNRNDTAIIADTVNTASRMEGVTKYYGANIILSEASINTIPNKEDFNFRYLGKVKVKGKHQAIGIYECFDGDDEVQMALKIKTLKDFEKGLKHFLNREFPKSSALFDKVLGKNPNDGVAQYFMTKSAEYTISGVPKDWEVINKMETK